MSTIVQTPNISKSKEPKNATFLIKVEMAFF